MDGADATDATARIVTWSPNRAVIELDGAAPGSSIVYNMNYDEGWRSDAGPVVSKDDKVAVRLDGARRTVTFFYRPPLFSLGVLLGALSAFACGVLAFRERRKRRRAVETPAQASDDHA